MVRDVSAKTPWSGAIQPAAPAATADSDLPDPGACPTIYLCARNFQPGGCYLSLDTSASMEADRRLNLELEARLKINPSPGG